MSSEIVPGKFKIREPKATCDELALSQFDLVLVPGVAFDRKGGRLGRGKGFYDQLLKEATNSAFCGVAFDEQVVAGIPSDTHDVPRRMIRIVAGDTSRSKVVEIVGISPSAVAESLT